MDRLAHYRERWSLQNPHLIAQTHTSRVYRADRDNTPVVLKLLNEVGIRDEQCGAVALRHFAGEGAARLLDATADAHLLEYLDGDDLIVLVDTGRDDDAAQVIADVVTTLHSVQQTTIPAGLHSLRRRFRSLFAVAANKSDTTLIHGAQVAERLLKGTKRRVVLHGDIHHWNIRQSQRGWLAFDPKGLYGENTYDVANALLNPAGMPRIFQDEARLLRHATLYAGALNVTRERVLAFAFAHACLSVIWSMEDGGDYHDTLAAARIMQAHVTV